MPTKHKTISPLKAFLFFSWNIPAYVNYIRLPEEKRYSFFQKYYYNKLARGSHYQQAIKKEKVVGTYEEHNRWKDHDTYIFEFVDDSFKQKMGLDFGCGPGRNIIQYHKKFNRLDGVDISEGLIKKARENLAYDHVATPHLYVNNGHDLEPIENESYDFIMSTITMQHICVYAIRFNLLKEFYRVLKPGGHIAIQMGYGKESPKSVDYYANSYGALTTNRGCDTRIESPDQLKKDLAKIGFINFTHNIRPTGPGDFHPSWIYFKAFKKTI